MQTRNVEKCWFSTIAECHVFVVPCARSLSIVDYHCKLHSRYLLEQWGLSEERKVILVCTTSTAYQKVKLRY